jgi:thymidylate synthase ThyX
MPENFTSDERRALAPYFTNTDKPVFALINLPETVKGALFARYSRSAKSLRRLFLDEFLGQVPTANAAPRANDRDANAHALDAHAGSRVDPGVGADRANRLYARVLSEYGDDSVAQLGGAHIACEGVSNILTKVLEWGRLMAYLEQSTRYVPYTDRQEGRWKYHVPVEIEQSPLAADFTATMDLAFDTYARWIPVMEEHFRRKYPKSADDSEAVYRSVIRAKALDTLRGLLPAATTSNVGLYGTGQAFEALLLRMLANPLEEVRACAALMLGELRQVIPAFLARIDQPDRGGRWIQYFTDTRRDFEAAAHGALADESAPASGAADSARRLAPASAGSLAASSLAATSAHASAESAGDPEVRLTEFDPDGEIKVVASALYNVSRLSDARLMEIARAMSAEERTALLNAYVGDRANRRHKPGRAFERTQYRFDILADYGAFRDLQRHRLLTLDWQPLSPEHGYVEPAAIEETGALDEWRTVMRRSAELHSKLTAAGLTDAAPYAVVMAYRVRFYMDMNAREAMHLIELRTSPQGHPAYRRICQQMHQAIADIAGHRAIADSMRFVDHSTVELERLQSERALDRKRRANAEAAR